MADNVPISAGVGTNVATEDVGGVHHQKVIIETSSGDGNATPVSAANPLPVDTELVQYTTGEQPLNANIKGTALIAPLDTNDIMTPLTLEGTSGGLKSYITNQGQSGMATSLSVTIASDQSAIPITAATLPLPTGAATAAKQDLLLAELQLKADLTETQPVSIAGSVPVTGTFFQATQPVSLATNTPTEVNSAAIKTAVEKIPAQGQALAAASMPVVLTAAQVSTLTPQTNALTDAQIRATPLPISGTVAANATLAAETTKVIGTVNVAGTVPVSGTFFQATQPVSIAAVVPVSDNGGSLTVDGTVAVSNFPATQPVTGTFFQATQPVSNAGTFAVQSTIAAALPAGTNNIGDVDIVTMPNVTLNAETTKVIGTVNIAASQSVQATGDIAHDGIDSGNPLKIGGKVSTAITTPVADADRVNAWFDEHGRQVVSDRDTELGLTIGTTGLRDRLFAQRCTVLSDSLADGIAGVWVQTVANGGTILSTGGEGRFLTSTAVNGSAKMSSPNVPYFPGQVAWMNSAIRFGDTGVAGNIRRIGMFTLSGDAPQEGFYYELSGTTLSANTVKAGVVTQMLQAAWTRNTVAPFTLDANYVSFEIRYTANTVWFYINNILRHAVSGTSSPLTSSLSLPITLQNVKTSGATDIGFYIRNIGNGRFGQQGGAVNETGLSAVDSLAVGGGTPHDSVDSGNPLKIGGRANLLPPTAVADGDRVNAWFSREGAQIVSPFQKITYRASTTAVLVPAVTSPNPFFTIYGSATRTIKIQSVVLSGLTLTAVAYLNIGLRRYSTAVAGGTSTALTKVAMDSSSAASSATNINAYTAIPTAGTTVGDISSRRVIGQATTAAAAGIPQIVDFDFTTGNSTEITLRGVAEGVGLYWITAPATTVSMLLRVEWTEE